MVKLNFRHSYWKPNIFLLKLQPLSSYLPNYWKMTLLWKENHYPPRWISITFIWFPTLCPRRIKILKEVLTKFHFSMNFPLLKKFANFIKDLQYEHSSIFPLWWRVKLNFRDRYRKPNIFFQELWPLSSFFTKFSKMALWYKKIITHPDRFVWPTYSQTHLIQTLLICHFCLVHCYPLEPLFTHWHPMLICPLICHPISSNLLN